MPVQTILENVHNMQKQLDTGVTRVMTAVAEVQQQVQTDGNATRQLLTDLMNNQENLIKQAFEDQRSFLECIHSNQVALAAQQRSIAQMTLKQIALVETNLIHALDTDKTDKLMRLLTDVSDYICQLRQATGELQHCTQ